ncbi:hypothetical protein GCM10011410_11280 [Hoyosella rhizosphaerae]|uniref:Uncharacterized protein n=1 Tax=Hoyosella rhizosphaerae TaxID=1755582 RepID=A0A916U5F2_9ACTN|nr:hypothetical protein GCM10011410_11280 [Hoyosella rhizosphaerae]
MHGSRHVSQAGGSTSAAMRETTANANYVRRVGFGGSDVVRSIGHCHVVVRYGKVSAFSD